MRAFLAVAPHACLLSCPGLGHLLPLHSPLLPRARAGAYCLRAFTSMEPGARGEQSRFPLTRAHVCASALRETLFLSVVWCVTVEVLKTEPTLSPRLVEARVPVPAQLPAPFAEARSSPKEGGGGGGGGGGRGDGGGGGKEGASAERSLTFRHQTAQTQSRHSDAQSRPSDARLSFPPSAPPPSPPQIRRLGNPFEDSQAASKGGQGAGLAGEGGRVSGLGAQAGGETAPHKGAAWADPLHRFYSMVGSAGEGVKNGRGRRGTPPARIPTRLPFFTSPCLHSRQSVNVLRAWLPGMPHAHMLPPLYPLPLSARASGYFPPHRPLPPSPREHIAAVPAVRGQGPEAQC
jgi:hypothetical protein